MNLIFVRHGQSYSNIKDICEEDPSKKNSFKCKEKSTSAESSKGFKNYNTLKIK